MVQNVQKLTTNPRKQFFMIKSNLKNIVAVRFYKKNSWFKISSSPDDIDNNR